MLCVTFPQISFDNSSFFISGFQPYVCSGIVLKRQSNTQALSEHYLMPKTRESMLLFLILSHEQREFKALHIAKIASRSVACNQRSGDMIPLSFHLLKHSIDAQSPAAGTGLQSDFPTHLTVNKYDLDHTHRLKKHDMQVLLKRKLLPPRRHLKHAGTQTWFSAARY